MSKETGGRGEHGRGAGQVISCPQYHVTKLLFTVEARIDRQAPQAKQSCLNLHIPHITISVVATSYSTTKQMTLGPYPSKQRKKGLHVRVGGISPLVFEWYLKTILTRGLIV